jgi:hypothetical protein
VLVDDCCKKDRDKQEVIMMSITASFAWFPPGHNIQVPMAGVITPHVSRFDEDLA